MVCSSSRAKGGDRIQQFAHNGVLILTKFVKTESSEFYHTQKQDCHTSPPNNALIYYLKRTSTCPECYIVCSTIEEPQRTGSGILDQVTRAEHQYTLLCSIIGRNPGDYGPYAKADYFNNLQLGLRTFQNTHPQCISCKS